MSIKRAMLLLLAGLLAPAVAIAQDRPDSRTMTCSAVRNLVNARGALIVGTGPYIYDRYVSGPGFCNRAETTDPAWIASADSQQCFVGYLCRSTAQRQSSR